MDRKLIAAVITSTVVAGAVAVVRLIDGVRMTTIMLKPRSLTPNEMRELIVRKYISSSLKYAQGLKWVASPDYLEGEKAVREMLIEYFKGLFNNREGRDELAKREADRLMSGATDRNKRFSVLSKASEVLAYPPSLLFLGPPGVGKSETVYESAREIARTFDLEFVDFTGSEDLVRISKEPWRYFVYVDLRLTSLEPADITGIPRARMVGERVSDYSPFAWAEALKLSPGILNLEEFTNVQRKDLISAAYQLVLDHRAGFTKFNKGVMVVALGNPPEWSAVAVRGIPTPLLNRFETFNVLPPTADEWVSYMNRKFGDEWYKPIGDLVKITKGEILLPKEERARKSGLTQSDQIPTPRSWTRLAVELYNIFSNKDDPIKYVTDLIKGIVRRYEGSCTKVTSMVPSMPDYNDEVKDMKLVCELFMANVGVDATRSAIMAIGAVEFDPRRHLASYEEFVRWFESTVDSLIKYGFKPEHATRIVVWWTIHEISYYLNELYSKNRRDEIKELAPILAKVVDFLYEKGASKPDIALMFSPVCARKDLEIKEILYKESKVVKEHVEEYMKKLLG